MPQKMIESLTVRPAVETDVDNIRALLTEYAQEHLLLGRTREDILEKLRNFRVGETDGEFVCCLALRHYGDNLYEVRSLAVKKNWVNRGIGSKLVSGAVEHLRKQGTAARIFALTYRAHFFCRLGFHIVDKEMFPQKIWSDCAICAKKDQCDETAVLLEIQ